MRPQLIARDQGETQHDSGLSRGRRAVAFALLGAVMLAVAAMSWSGLYGFATATMHWSPIHAALVPIALDVAALACAFLALDSVSRNDSAIAFRLITAALIGLSAFLNWRHALGTHNVAEQVFFPSMSVLSYALVDAVIRKSRRDIRRDRAGLPAREAPAPLPRPGIAAWLRFPGRAFGATSNALAQRIPATAEPLGASERRAYATGVLDGLSQADAIRRAIETVGAEPRQVVAWLAENGREVATQRVYDVMRRDGIGRHGRPEVRVIEGGNQQAQAG